MPRHRVILLADDDVLLRNFIRTLLRDKRYEVLVAADGIEALELSQAHPGTVDLLLTDLEMPHKDGISAYRQISAERPNIKVLFMSGGSISSRLKLPDELWHFLAKPFGADTLLTRVKEILEGPSPARAGSLKVILVVDHDADRRARTQKILVENGFGVLTSSNVEEAEVISDTITKIDLIVSGVVFAGESGVHLAEHVRASQRGISTLLISHFDRNVLRGISGFSGQPEFLPNPFTPEALMARVRALLRTPR